MYCPFCIHHLTVIAEVILIVIVERELVLGSFIHRSRLSISTIKQNLVNLAVPHYKASAEKVVGRVGMLNHEWFLFTMYCSVCSSIAHFNGKNKQKKLYNQEKQRKDYMQK